MLRLIALLSIVALLLGGCGYSSKSKSKYKKQHTSTTQTSTGKSGY